MRLSTRLQKSPWPWSNLNIEKVAKCGLNNDMFMPGLGFLNIGDVGSWKADLAEAANSKKLWINSLLTPHGCLIFSEGAATSIFYKKSIEFLDAYLSQYSSREGLFDIAWEDEHAVSNRLYVLISYIFYLLDLDIKLLESLDLFAHAEQHASWLAHDSHYVSNNHGVMMDFSLLHYSVLIESINPSDSSKYMEVSLSRLNVMLEKTFDSEGYCTENSPSYHFLNYSLFQSIRQFVSDYQLKVDVQKWDLTLAKARTVGNLLRRSDGTIPLIGDSESSIGVFFPPLQASNISTKIGFYPESGLLVFSDTNTYFTFRAGGKSFSHRHVDDLSITLWCQGRELIVDPGLYNYDSSDKLRRAFISADYHSGFYLQSQGHVLFRNFKAPSDMSSFTSYHMHSDSSFSVEATQALSRECEVLRSVRFSNNIFHINDRFHCATKQNWNYQLILHPDVEIRVDIANRSIVMINGPSSVIFSWKSLEAECKLDFKNVFYSEKFMEKKASKKLLLYGVSKSLDLETSFAINVTNAGPENI